MSAQPSLVTHRGGCHCRRVRFEVQAPEWIEAEECNCSICRMGGYLHLSVAAERFTLLSGSEDLTTYTFNTGTAKHLFCRHCGVKSFYRPRSRPDGYSVNVHCLDAGTLKGMNVRAVDGRNWESAFPSGKGDYR